MLLPFASAKEHIRRFVKYQYFALYTKIPSVFVYDKARLGQAQELPYRITDKPDVQPFPNL